MHESTRLGWTGGRLTGAWARPPTAYCADVRRAAAGQAIIETALTVMMICLLFFGLVQLALLFTAHDVLQYAANKGARARTVGFNDFMVYKTTRVGAIANAGRMTFPDPPAGLLSQSDLELATIPFYLGAPNHFYLPGILDYADWSTISHSYPVTFADGTLEVRVSQNYPLRMPMHRAFYAADNVRMQGECTMDNHYQLYLDEQGW